MQDVAAHTVGHLAANDIELGYETFGDRRTAGRAHHGPGDADDRLAGRAVQRPGPERPFVVRFGNRDVGESTHLRNLPPPGQPCAHAAPTTASAREFLAACNVRRS